MALCYDGSMDKEEFKQLLRDQTESLITTMEVMLQQNKTDMLDQVTTIASASERRLVEKLASKEEVRDHERRIAHLEEVAG